MLQQKDRKKRPILPQLTVDVVVVLLVLRVVVEVLVVVLAMIKQI